MNNQEFENLLADCIDFTKRLIQTPSMPGEEAKLADMVIDEMQKLDFDSTCLDSMGNVTGKIFGSNRDLGAIVLNSHLDHVDPGDVSLWPVPPYSAAVVDDQILGRGACDIKGPLAVQVYCMAALKRLNRVPLRDIVFSGVVEEEVGGAGAIHWADNVDFPVDLIILGEPSSNNLSLGHRGIVQMWITFAGRSVHASAPERGENPNYALVDFLWRLRQEADSLSSHVQLGRTTVTPTIIEVDTQSMNVTPAWTRVLLDFRTASESPNSLVRFICDVADGLDFQISDGWAKEPGTPVQSSDEEIYGYYTPDNASSVIRMRELVAKGMGWEPDLVNYKFATDGRHLLSIGAPIIGFSPGEEHLAHTVQERIAIPMMADSLKGHIAFISEF